MSVTSLVTLTQNVEKTILENGLRVITERMPHVCSVAAGVWVDAGSRHESDEESGISHFIEHMVFKGTEQRSAEDIACAIDAIGGHLDAFTTKETVAFTAKVLDEHLPQAFDVLSDLSRHPAFRDEDIAKEKGVVLEELKMDEDNPDYLIHDMFSRGFWKDQALGRPIIGNPQTITSFGREQLQRFFRHAYCPSNLLITAAGNLRHDDVVQLAEERFGDLEPQSGIPARVPPQPTPSIQLRNKPSLEQTHLCLGVPCHAANDPRRYPAFVLNVVLGGGFSSRLFLKIREREGLVYSVYSDLNLYSDAGCLTVYAGTSLKSVDRVVMHVMQEFRTLKDKLIGPEELQRAKEHLKGSLMLSLESTTSRMSNLARQEKYFGQYFPLEDIRQRVEAVTAEQVREVANEWLQQDHIALALLGDLQGHAIGREALAC